MAQPPSAELPGIEDLPNGPKLHFATNVSLQSPLSRRGKGPGLIVIDPGYKLSEYPSAEPPSTTLDPAPQYKWAEEGYAVVRIVIRPSPEDGDLDLPKALSTSLDLFKSFEDCDVKDKFALIVYGTPEEYPSSFASDLEKLVDSETKIVASVCFASFFNASTSSRPQLVHRHGKDSPAEKAGVKVFTYPEVSSADFIIPESPGFSYSSAAVSHTRSLGFIKKHLDGPYFDLEAIWDEHTYFEFENRSVEKTMATMVREPYVNHIPTMTGGIGRKRLTDFYTNHFIWNNPDDTVLELISRTVGVDRIVDEFIFVFTHTKEVDWLIPGIPATGIKLRIPFHAVVNIRGDRLYHEHIGWDQSTVLRQLGMLPEYLPFPHSVPGHENKKLECKLPVAGVETSLKMKDQRSVESNTLFVPAGEGLRECK